MTQLYCPRCSKRFQADSMASFCSICGTKLQAVSEEKKNYYDMGDVLNGIKLNRIQKSCLEFKAAFLMLLICYIVFFKVIQDLNPNSV